VTPNKTHFVSFASISWHLGKEVSFETQSLDLIGDGKAHRSVSHFRLEGDDYFQGVRSIYIAFFLFANTEIASYSIPFRRHLLFHYFTTLANLRRLCAQRPMACIPTLYLSLRMTKELCWARLKITCRSSRRTSSTVRCELHEPTHIIHPHCLFGFRKCFCGSS